MKGIISVILAAAMCSLTVFAAPLPLIDSFKVESEAAVVIEAQTGRIAFWQNADEKLPMASTTKIMTALITLEQTEIDKPFVVDANAIKVEGSSMGLKAGDTVTLRILAAGMLLSSGNDAANSAAVKIAGSVPKFVKLMNERAARMGMKNTSFETPSGLDGKNHYSSAYDMAILAKNAIANPEFLKICSSKSMAMEYGNPPFKRWLSNHNRLLSEYDGAIGVKTGFTKKSGRCLVSAAQKEGVTLIAVTLNCGDDWNTHKNLYNQCFPLFEHLKPEIPPNCYTVDVGGGTRDKVELVASDFFGITVAKSDEKLIKSNIYLEKFVFAPVDEGQILGKIEISLAGIPIATQLLTASTCVPARTIEKQSLWDKIYSYFN